MRDPFHHAAVLAEVHAALRDRGLEPSPAQQKRILTIVGRAVHGSTAVDPVAASLAVMGAGPPVEEPAKSTPPEPVPPKPVAPTKRKPRSLKDLSDVDRQRLKRDVDSYIVTGTPPKRQIARDYGISDRQVTNEEVRQRKAKAPRGNRGRS